MYSHSIKLILFSCLIFQLGCGVAFKRKTANEKTTKVEFVKDKLISTKKSDMKKTDDFGKSFNRHDKELITSYYSDKANTVIRRDMMTHTKVSKKQVEKFVVGESISRDIQVMPLPLKLKRTLSSTSLHTIRVMVDTHVILMNVKSRVILDIIRI